MNKIEEWIKVKKEEHPFSGLDYDDVDKCLNIIEHLMKAVNVYADRSCWKEDNIFVAYKKYPEEVINLAREAIEACEKEI